METQNNNPAPRQYYYHNRGSNGWWKILLGLAAGAGALYAYTKYFQTPELPIVIPPEDPPFNENLEITLWKNFFLSTGTDKWPNAIMEKVITSSGDLAELFRAQLQREADNKYAHEGLTSGSYRTGADRQIQARILAIKRVSKWVESIQDQAVERGISYQDMLEIQAIYGIVEEKIKAFLVRYQQNH